MRYKLLATAQFRRDVEDIFEILDRSPMIREPEIINHKAILSAIYDRAENPKAAEVFYPYEGSDAYYFLEVADCMIYYVVYDDIMELRRVLMPSLEFTEY